MAISQAEIEEMDKISGLPEQEFNDMDNIAMGTQPEQQEPIKAGISVDVTPSGLYKNSQDAVASAIAAPIIAKRDNISLKDAYNRNMSVAKQHRKENPTPVQDFLLDTAGYTGLSYVPGLQPVAAAKNAGTLARLGNLALNSAKLGAIPGALEGLKNGVGDSLAGALTGTGIAGVLQGVPYIGSVAANIGKKVALNSFPGLKEKTVKQLIKPGSKALEMTDETAQQALTNTTERIQKNYKEMLEKAGRQVDEAARNLTPERGVYDTALKDALNDIYAGHSTSGVKAINPAYNNAGDVYSDVLGYIEAAADPANKGKISASKLNDIIGNIKNYSIDWNKTSAKDKSKILKQIYGEYSRRLGNLSPELRAANKQYSKLAQFEDNEGVRRIINPDVIKKENIDTASEALRNYNKSISSGNKNRNIHDLEKLLVENGYEPFINQVDDINAANELLKTAETGINPLGSLDKIKLMERPILKALRAYNSSEIPGALNAFTEKIRPGLNWTGDVARRVIPASIISNYGN